MLDRSLIDRFFFKRPDGKPFRFLRIEGETVVFEQAGETVRVSEVEFFRDWEEISEADARARATKGGR